MKLKPNVITLLVAAVGVGGLVVVGVTLFGPAPSDEVPLQPEDEIVQPEDPNLSPVPCTLMACLDGATVEFTGEVPPDYHVEVVGSSGETWQTDCHLEPGMAEGAGCLPTGGVRIDGIIPESFTITVTWEGGSATETFQPDYQTFQPNGPQCEPTCQQANLTMSLP